MVLRAKNVRIEGKAAEMLSSALSELSVASKGLTIGRIKMTLDDASMTIGAAIRLGFSVRETYANGLTNPVPQFAEQAFLMAMVDEVGPRHPAIVPVFLDADGLGHAVVVDKVFQRIRGSGEFVVSLRDPATGTRHVPPWEEFAEAAGSAVMRVGAIVTLAK
ncbi:MAG TPA: hypothetical protein VNH11_09135 [Pirellulales bacterium]|nr:hypothetical protein [Pirellulales bacterium]